MNQYIGARYVPLLAGEWDATKSYEYLTTVSSGNNSYTSRQNVPAGTPLTNTDYWMQTGNYGAQLSEIENDISELQSQTSELNSKVGRGSEWKGKKVVWIGDSWCTTDSGATTLFANIVANNLGFGEMHLDGTGGMGYVHGGNFATRIPVIATTLGEGANLIDYVFIYGSINDYTEEISAIQNQVKNCQNLISQYFPNAEYICIPTIGNHNFSLPVGYNWTKPAYAVIDACLNNGIRYFYLPFILCDTSNTMLADNVHPNNAGHIMIGKYLTQALLGNIMMTEARFSAAGNNIVVCFKGTQILLTVHNNANFTNFTMTELANVKIPTAWLTLMLNDPATAEPVGAFSSVTDPFNFTSGVQNKPLLGTTLINTSEQ